MWVWLMRIPTQSCNKQLHTNHLSCMLMFLPNIKIVKTNLCVFRLLALHRIESTQRTSNTRGGVSSSFPLPFPPIFLLEVLNQLLIWFKSRSWYNLSHLTPVILGWINIVFVFTTISFDSGWINIAQVIAAFTFSFGMHAPFVFEYRYHWWQ